MPVSLQLCLVFVDAPFHLARERPERLGSQAVARVLFGSSDVFVHHVLGLELSAAALVGALEGPGRLACVIHHVQQEFCVGGISR